MRRFVSTLFALVMVASTALPLAAQYPPPLKEPFTVDSLWMQLIDGNKLYKGGAIPYTGLDKARQNTEKKQNPPVTVLYCSDSRVPAELAFARGVGDLFGVRAAGNVADTFGIASIEYGIAKGWTKVIVVLGHESCGAVEEALKKTDPPTPSLIALVNRIRKSFPLIDPNDKDSFRAAIIANAKGSADYLVGSSKVIRDAVKKKQVTIVVAYYELGSGNVRKIR